MITHNIYEIEAKLDEYTPTISRKFIINGERSVAYLGYTLMAMFHMDGSHLFELSHEFEFMDHYSKKITYTIPFPDNQYEFENGELHDALTTKVNEFLNKQGTYEFIYDYGDYWQISLNVINIEQQDISLVKIPKITEGQGFGIIDNIGGISGLADYAEATTLGKGKTYEMYDQWLEYFPDMQEFDKNEMNNWLKNAITVLKRQYEDVDW